jgi:hypothetical protein
MKVRAIRHEDWAIEISRNATAKAFGIGGNTADRC